MQWKWLNPKIQAKSEKIFEKDSKFLYKRKKIKILY